MTQQRKRNYEERKKEITKKERKWMTFANWSSLNIPDQGQAGGTLLNLYSSISNEFSLRPALAPWHFALSHKPPNIPTVICKSTQYYYRFCVLLWILLLLCLVVFLFWFFFFLFFVFLEFFFPLYSAISPDYLTRKATCWPSSTCMRVCRRYSIRNDVKRPAKKQSC